MRVVTNKKLARRNRQTANYLFFATLALLIGGFIFINYSLFTNTTPDDIIILMQALILPAALVLTLVSVRQTNLWARRPHPEDALEEGLKGLSRKSILYSYYHFPVRHILIAPQGVFAIVTRWHNRSYSNSGAEWKTLQNPISRWFSALRMDGIGNPTRDAERAVEYVKGLLEDIAPDVEVHPVIIFTDATVELELEDPTIPVLYADTKHKPNLKAFLRDMNKDQSDKQKQKSIMPLTDEQIEAFEEASL